MLLAISTGLVSPCIEPYSFSSPNIFERLEPALLAMVRVFLLSINGELAGRVCLQGPAHSSAHRLGTLQAVAQGSFSATLEAMWLLLILEIVSRDSFLSAVSAVD